MAECGSYICALTHDTAYSSKTNLDFVDISNPAVPRVVGSFSSSGNLFDLKTEAGLAIVADPDIGLRIIDISDPISIYEEGSIILETLSDADLAISGSYLYVQKVVYIDNGFTIGLSILDISNPSSPREIGYYEGINGFDMQISGSHLFVTFGSQLEIYDISDPINPVIVYSSNYTNTDFTDFVISGDFLYVVDSTIGFRIFDISNLSSVSEISVVPLPSAYTLAVFGSNSYVIDTNKYLHVIDISNPYTPV